MASSCSRGVNSSRAWAGWGLAPRPPATKTRKPASVLPSGNGRETATTPTSLNMAWPQSVTQPGEVDLELAREPLSVRVVQEVAEGGLGPRG